MKKLLFTVCGRGGSKGVPNKNIRPFLGRPLMEYTLRVIDLYREKHPDEFCDIVVSTDSREFIDLLTAKQDLIIRERPAELAQDASPKLAVIADALAFVEAKTKGNYEFVVDLDITSPIRTAEDVEAAIARKRSRGDTDVVFSVTTARRSPWFNMVIKRGAFYERVMDTDFVVRQQAPEVFDMNASIYVYARDFVLSGASSALKGAADVIFMRDTGVIDIDCEEDFALMELIAHYLSQQHTQYQDVFRIPRTLLR